MLNFARLRLLVELDRLGTVAAVAHALDYTPSAVSQQLTQLQAESPQPLLEKVGRRLRLTDAGQLLAQHGRELMARAEQAESELAGFTDLARGTLHLAGFETAARELLTPAMVELQTRYPGLRCELHDTEAELALPLLRAGELDLVVAEEYEHAPRPRHPDLERQELLDDALLAAVPLGHPLAETRDDIPLRALAGESWVAPRDGTAYGDMLVRACRTAGFEPDLRHRVNDLQTILSLVAGGMGVALVPSLGRPELRTDVELRNVKGRRLSRSVFAATRTGAAEQRPALSALLEALRRAPALRPPARGTRAGRPVTSARSPGRPRSAGS